MKLRENKLLSTLVPVIKQWKVLVEKYSDVNKAKDALYWYNERATLSTFAGAIWLSGGTVLEEFSSTKINSRKKESRKKKSGRTDLWFNWRGKEYIVEAKQISPSMDPRKTTVVNELEKYLKEACKDAKNFVPPTGHKKYIRMGVVFLSPYLSRSYRNKQEIVKTKIFDLRGELSQKHGYRLLAWIFPPSTRKLQDTNDGLIYPGVALVAKVI